jgi:hypothetical protein
MAAADPDGNVTVAARVGWHVVHLSRASVSSLEDSAVRIVTAQSAGLVALWSQLHTFDVTAAAVFAWIAWVVLIASVAWLGVLVTPRRLSHFWEGLLSTYVPKRDAAIVPQRELEIAADLTGSMQRQLLRLRRGLRVSIALAIVALALVAIAYVVEKAGGG